MSEDSKLSWKIKTQMSRYAVGLTEGFDKVKRRFVDKMLGWGIIGRGAVVVRKRGEALTASLRGYRMGPYSEAAGRFPRKRTQLSWTQQGAGA